MSMQSTMQGRSGDVAFMDMIEDGTFEGVVHSVFHKALNMQCRISGDLYTLVAGDLDDGPCTIVVDAPDFLTLGIEPGAKAVAASGTLRIADRIAVSIAGAAPWQMAATPRACDDHRLRESLQAARALLEDHGRRGGMMEAPECSAVSRAITEMLRSSSNLLVDALRRDDGPTALRHAARLIGLGPGLTPSGDDFLVGLLAALRAGRTVSPAVRAFCVDVAEMARVSTNPISYAAIRKAAQGEVRETIALLLLHLCGHTQGSLQPALDQVLAIGSSSGTDIAWGIMRGLESTLPDGEQGHGVESRR
jgi:hypothetical protein